MKVMEELKHLSYEGTDRAGTVQESSRVRRILSRCVNVIREVKRMKPHASC